VTYQLKILTTALFSILLLNKHISWLQGVSLIVLTIGVACVQLSGGSSTTINKSIEKQNPMFGLICVLLACFSSGFAGRFDAYRCIEAF